jgi:hypothetical protein
VLKHLPHKSEFLVPEFKPQYHPPQKKKRVNRVLSFCLRKEIGFIDQDIEGQTVVGQEDGNLYFHFFGRNWL